MPENHAKQTNAELRSSSCDPAVGAAKVHRGLMRDKSGPAPNTKHGPCTHHQHCFLHSDLYFVSTNSFDQHPSMNKTLATAAAAAITGAAAYSIITWRHISTIDTSNVSFTDSNPDSFQTSESVTSIINPKGHVSANDSRSITVKPHHSHTDEVILARFMNGFFGGYVFAIERTILRTMRLNLVNFSCE